jgi:hypothetical protein
MRATDFEQRTITAAQKPDRDLMVLNSDAYAANKGSRHLKHFERAVAASIV